MRTAAPGDQSGLREIIDAEWSGRGRRWLVEVGTDHFEIAIAAQPGQIVAGSSTNVRAARHELDAKVVLKFGNGFVQGRRCVNEMINHPNVLAQIDCCFVERAIAPNGF